MCFMLRFPTVFYLLWSAAVLIWGMSGCSTGKTYSIGPVQTFPDPLIEKNNTWRGGAIGASLGNPLEGKVKEISDKASQEAAREGKPVAYLSLDGFQRVEIFSLGKRGSGKCHFVREKIFQEGKLVHHEIKETCP